MTKCPECGRIAEDEEQFCKDCGIKLFRTLNKKELVSKKIKPSYKKEEDIEEHNYNKRIKSADNNKLILYIILGFIGLIFLLFLIKIIIPLMIIAVIVFLVIIMGKRRR